MPSLLDLLRRHLISDAPPLSRAERWRSTLAGFFGLLLFESVLYVLPLDAVSKVVLAPIGATSVILFALPHSPLAQPWPVVGGLLLSAPIGFACGIWLPDGPWVLAVALAITLWLTAWTRCIHPPAGAMAITMAVAATHGAGMGASMLAAMANTLAILVSVTVVNNLIPGRRYPQGTPPAVQQQAHVAPPAIAHRDLAAAQDEIDGFLDIREDDLVDLYQRALRHAFNRMHGLDCGDLVADARALPAVEFATPLTEAWTLMSRHRADALPVVDRSRRVIGLLAFEDVLHAVPADKGRSLAGSVREALARSPLSHSDKPEVVGQIMRDAGDGLLVACSGDGVAATADALANRRQSAVPVVDADQRLVGLLGRDDLIAVLYNRIALEDATREALAG